ncbi:MAG TPA: hypothetical protein VMW63_09850 [Methanoregulaceae archaeon]|nr:hypothetical protein [Methanoregulaceae archaeon]
MKRIIALGAIFALLCIPGAVLAAGMQGSGSGNGIEKTEINGQNFQNSVQDGQDQNQVCNNSGQCVIAKYQFGTDSESEPGSHQISSEYSFGMSENGKMQEIKSRIREQQFSGDRIRNMSRLKTGSCGAYSLE